MTFKLFNQVSLTSAQLNFILESISVNVDEFTHYQSNDRITDFLLDGTRMFRLSRQKMPEIDNLKKVEHTIGIARIYASGSFEHENQNLYYAITDFIPGDTLFDSIDKINVDQAKNLGKEIAHFIRKLHMIKKSTYDIGHYVPVISAHLSTWKSGHELYIQYIKQKINMMSLNSEALSLLESAFNRMDCLMSTLDYSTGPRFLHNDLHPKNIIIHEGHLSGVIDWECAQYGESDFELTHFMHWMHFSMDSSQNFKALVDSLIETYQLMFNVPDLYDRLMIYQLEHEIIQIVWNPSNQIERLEKIKVLLTDK